MKREQSPCGIRRPLLVHFIGATARELSRVEEKPFGQRSCALDPILAWQPSEQSLDLPSEMTREDDVCIGFGQFFFESLGGCFRKTAREPVGDEMLVDAIRQRL